MRYEIGDFVSKPVTGVCRIEDILYLDAQGKKDNKLYYRMHPVEDEKETIYVPVSNSDSALRPCLTEENAWKLIEKIPEISTPWTENEKMREQKYKEAIKANDQRKQQRLAQGKKCTATDTKYFQIAEKLLYEELGTAIGKPKQEIVDTLVEHIGQNSV